MIDHGDSRRLVILVIASAALALGIASPALALPYLSVGRARHNLELRFAREEESRDSSGTDELRNCYRLSSTHVNCYSEEHSSAESCEVWLWRVWEYVSQRDRERHECTLAIKGHFWEPCPET